MSLALPHSPTRPMRTIRDIQESLPEERRGHFDVEPAGTEIEAPRR